MKEITALKKPYIFVVLEHNTPDGDARVHGIYTTREIADRKVYTLHKRRLQQLSTSGYFSILKKPIQGPKLKSQVISSLRAVVTLS